MAILRRLTLASLNVTTIAVLAKINFIRGAISIFALALLLSGCTPAGPRAVLAGKKYLDRGDVANAVIQFRRATTLLDTNAAAWNYYGVALQRAGQADAAAAAYQNALRYDHDLVEVHYNLGNLWLEQNQPESAKLELTAFTLRRPNNPEGWLKLASAQLRTGESLPAERSYSYVLSLKSNDAEAYNGLGLARLQEGKTRDAMLFFAAAVRARPDFGPALLNLATINLEYLHDHKAALASYHAYLALTPPPANYNEVKAVVAGLEQSEMPVPATLTPTVRTSTPTETKPKAVTVARPAPLSRPEPARTESEPFSVNRMRTATPTGEANPAPIKVEPAPEIITTPKPNSPGRLIATRPRVVPSTTPTNTDQVEAETPQSDEDQPQPGFWRRLLRPRVSETAKANNTDMTANEEMAGTKTDTKPLEGISDSKPRSVARYPYTSPARPAAGDRRAAEAAFTKAQLAEQAENWVEAAQWYVTAAANDPSWFEAQYNAGVIAHRLHNYALALPHYEVALAIDPSSLDARYNFALALRSSSYPLDAANELKKLIEVTPNDVRAHLALANIFAHTLHDIPQARQHYLKVLALEPNHPQATDIRFWLSANAQ